MLPLSHRGPPSGRSKATCRCRVWRVAALITAFLPGLLPPDVVMFFAMVFFMTGLSMFASVPVDQPYWAEASVVSLTTSWGMHMCQLPSVSHHMPTDLVKSNMSFACGTLILGYSMHRHRQGLAATLVATTVICSILLGSWVCCF